MRDSEKQRLEHKSSRATTERCWRAKDFQRVLAKLSPLEQEFLFMRRLDRMTYQAIAETLSITPQTVERHMARIIYAVASGLTRHQDDSVHSVCRRLGLHR